MRRLVLFVAALACLLFATAPAGAALRLGVVGDKARFRSQTGQRSQVDLTFTRWGTGLKAPFVLDRKFNLHGPIPMLSFGTRSPAGREAVTPRGIANGRGDRYLLAVSRAASRFGKTAYLRPLAEMNGHWNLYCAYNRDGRLRGRAYSTANFRRAFRRMYIILHGGTRAEINARFSRLGLPALGGSGDLPPNPLVRVVWNPQGFGSPNLPGNRANAYYPGDGFVDVVANDLYDINFRAAWEANLALYRSHPTKPYAIGEWGLWGIDDPAFVRRMAAFVRTHRRVETIVYYKSARGSVFDLGTKPRSRAAYRRYIVPLAN